MSALSVAVQALQIYESFTLTASHYGALAYKQSLSPPRRGHNRPHFAGADQLHAYVYITFPK